MRGWVLEIKVANPLDKALHAALLEDTHQWRAQSFGGIGGDFCYGRLGAIALLNVAAGDLAELEVAGDIGRYEDIGELTRGDEKFWDKVNIPVVDAAVLGPRLLAGGKVTVLPVELEGSCKTSFLENT